MTCREKLAIEHPEKISMLEPGGCIGCPTTYDYGTKHPLCNENYPDICTVCWDQKFIEDKEKKEQSRNLFYEQLEKESLSSEHSPKILDSGNRRQFETGAVRDIQEGKGRCDLLPLDVVAEYFNASSNCKEYSYVFDYINAFQTTGDTDSLIVVLGKFTEDHWGEGKTMLLEVSKHFEEGTKKYGENNWQKGIPVRCYIDSAVRHYLKFLRGDKDEPHSRAFVWNILCAIWTCKHKPELNEYAQILKTDINIPKELALGIDKEEV